MGTMDVLPVLGKHLNVRALGGGRRWRRAPLAEGPAGAGVAGRAGRGPPHAACPRTKLGAAGSTQSVLPSTTARQVYLPLLLVAHCGLIYFGLWDRLLASCGSSKYRFDRWAAPGDAE